MPSKPSFSGLWEAEIKSLRCHLKSVVRGKTLIHEEFLTVIAQLEEILDSRSLCPLSANEDGFDILTRAHILFNRSLNSVVEPNLTNLKDDKEILEMSN